MNIKNVVLGLTLGLMYSSSGFAYVSGKVPVKEKILFCPQKIVCSKISDRSSCKYETQDQKFWAGLESDNRYPGTYSFESAESGYHETSHLYQTKCNYRLGGGGQGSGVTLTANQSANLEAYYDKSTNWRISDRSNGSPVYCTLAKPETCPLKMISGFGLLVKDYKKFPTYYFSMSVDGTPIIGRLGVDVGNKSDNYTVISYSDAAVCWSTKLCRIDIIANQGISEPINLGSVIVDMDNKMVINNINKSINSRFKISIQKPFNVIEISDNSGNDVDPMLEIANLTKLNISAKANGVVIPYMNDNAHMFINYQDTKTACHNAKICSITLAYSVGIGGGGVEAEVGSIQVDLNDDRMSVLSVRSVRPSEIMISQISPQSVKISYPFK